MKCRRITGIILLVTALLANIFACTAYLCFRIRMHEQVGIIGGADAPTLLFLLQKGHFGALLLFGIGTYLLSALGAWLILGSKSRTRKESPHDSETWTVRQVKRI